MAQIGVDVRAGDRQKRQAIVVDALERISHHGLDEAVEPGRARVTPGATP